MGDRLDNLLGELAAGADAGAPDELEAAVWQRIDTRQAARANVNSRVFAQCAIGACVLVVSFSYQAFQGSRTPSTEPAFQLLGGTMVADAGTFQVLR